MHFLYTKANYASFNAFVWESDNDKTIIDYHAIYRFPCTGSILARTSYTLVVEDCRSVGHVHIWIYLVQVNIEEKVGVSEKVNLTLVAIL